MEAILSKSNIATLAGGCFWGVEELFRVLPGVIDVIVGYTGGTSDNPTYNEVKTGGSGHAEAVRITFDPSQIHYREILDHFFRLHDPTTLNRQGNDIGSQYRSSIFYHDEMQKEEALRAIDRAKKSGRWQRPIVTTVEPASIFYPAEEEHQDYLQKHPHGYTCHFLRD